MKKKIDINTILIGLTVIFIVVGCAFFYIGKNANKKYDTKTNYATVYVYNEIVKEISLKDTGVYTIEGGAYPVTLEVKDGKICFENSRCPDHLCEGFGWICNEMDYAICAPAGVGVIIETGTDLQANADK